MWIVDVFIILKYPHPPNLAHLYTFTVYTQQDTVDTDTVDKDIFIMIKYPHPPILAHLYTFTS